MKKQKEAARGGQGTGARWTRGRVAEELGISVSGVRKREGKDLHPERDEKGVWRFDRKEVEQLAQRHGKKERRMTPGEVAAEVFRRLDQHATLFEIVTELKQTPETIRKLAHEFQIDLVAGERRIQRREAEQEVDRELRRHEAAQDADRLAWEKAQTKMRIESEREERREEAARHLRAKGAPDATKQRRGNGGDGEPET